MATVSKTKALKKRYEAKNRSLGTPLQPGTSGVGIVMDIGRQPAKVKELFGELPEIRHFKLDEILSTPECSIFANKRTREVVVAYWFFASHLVLGREVHHVALRLYPLGVALRGVQQPARLQTQKVRTHRRN